MATAKSYQQLSIELDEIMLALEAPEADIDEALKLYERAQSLIGELDKYLKTAETKVIKLKAKFAES